MFYQTFPLRIFSRCCSCVRGILTSKRSSLIVLDIQKYSSEFPSDPHIHIGPYCLLHINESCSTQSKRGVRQGSLEGCLICTYVLTNIPITIQQQNKWSLSVELI